MNSLPFTTALALALFSTPVQAARPGTQPRMENAIEALGAARDSKDPLPQLEKAEKLLQRGENKINARRNDALDAVRDAIAAAKKGEDAKGKITKAIAIVRSAEDRRKSSNVR